MVPPGPGPAAVMKIKVRKHNSVLAEGGHRPEMVLEQTVADAGMEQTLAMDDNIVFGNSAAEVPNFG